MIIFLTDFEDYANVLKGVIRAMQPSVEFMDLSNTISPFNIIEGAWMLYNNYHYFPKGSIFLCVVDPGVGSKRKGIIIQSKDYTFIGPDNGLMYAAAMDNGIYRTFEIDENKVNTLAKGVFHRRYKKSATFHGRDIFALVAASLENEFSMNFMGKVVQIEEKLDIMPREKEGMVVSIDHYGNIITNITSPHLIKQVTDSQHAVYNGHTAHTLKIKIKKTWQHIKLYGFYDAAKKGELIGLINSQGVLEIAKKRASASKSLKLKVGEKISIA